MRSPAQVVHRASLLAMESGTKEKAKKVSRLHASWTRPPRDIVKVNCDGAFFAETKTGSWGFVIRDHNGHASVVGSGSLGAVHDVECAEAQACIAGLQAASSHGMGRIILESDSVNTVKALQSDERDLSPASVLYKEARELILSSFISVQIAYIPRSCNRSAHELARLSLDWDPDQPHVWLDPLPSFVSDILVRDSAEPCVHE
jgi:ribonuclease HI